MRNKYFSVLISLFLVGMAGRADAYLLAQGGGGPRVPLGGGIVVPPGDAQVRAQITQFYRLILNREPDSFGMNYYLGRFYNDRWTLEQIRQDIANSSEARSIRERIVNDANSGRQNPRFRITQMYRQILRREPDDFGMNYYLGRFYNDGWTMERILYDIYNSSEARRLRNE
jgi:hypothetical protein